MRGAADSDAAGLAPGRSCPLHYRYAPTVFASPAQAGLAKLDVLYVVGGLYGNELALQRTLQLFERERGRKSLVFNGDFHWFDIDPERFARVQQAVLAHTALRGNVETELAAEPPADADDSDDPGCGCAYPGWVGDDVVERSNRILSRLRQATTPTLRAELAALPMWQRADVGGLKLGIVHGDAVSLAGWGFAQEHLHSPVQREWVRGWFQQAGVDAFACTHTCLPVFQPLQRPGAGAPAWVFNNGAAGMPNFAHDNAGLLTRIALSPWTGPERRFGVRAGDVFVDGLAIDTDTPESMRQFTALWPAGSDAHASYFQRLSSGPQYTVADVVRTQA